MKFYYNSFDTWEDKYTTYEVEAATKEEATSIIANLLIDKYDIKDASEYDPIEIFDRLAMEQDIIVDETVLVKV